MVIDTCGWCVIGDMQCIHNRVHLHIHLYMYMYVYCMQLYHRSYIVHFVSELVCPDRCMVSVQTEDELEHTVLHKAVLCACTMYYAGICPRL